MHPPMTPLLESFTAPRAGTPAAVIQAVAEAARAAALDPDVQAIAATAGGETAFLGTEDFARFLATDRARWERTVATLGKH